MLAEEVIRKRLLQAMGKVRTFDFLFKHEPPRSNRDLFTDVPSASLHAYQLTFGS